MLLSEPGKVIRCADHLQVLLALPAETIDLILAAPGKQEFFKRPAIRLPVSEDCG